MSHSPASPPPTSRRFMSWLLRSPLHIFMGSMLLMTVTGRKTGRPITTPLGYVRDRNGAGDTLLIVSKSDRTWWRNLRGGAPITLVLHGKTYRANANPIEQPPEREQALLHFLRLFKHTLDGVQLTPEGQPVDREKFQHFVQDRLVIKITQLQEGVTDATTSRV